MYSTVIQSYIHTQSYLDTHSVIHTHTYVYTYTYVYVCAQLLSSVRLFATSWTIVHQAPLSMEFSRQEYWSGLPFPSLGDIPHPGIEPMCPESLALAGGFFTTEPLKLPATSLTNTSLFIFTFSFGTEQFLEDLWRDRSKSVISHLVSLPD